MAKKRKKRPQQRPRPRPQTGAADAAATREAAESEGGLPASRRAERKEEARRERERRIKQARRKQRTRRLIRWGILLLVVATIAAIVWFAGKADRENQIQAERAADRIGCTEVEVQDAQQANEHVEPYASGEAGVPAFGGNHTGGVLNPEPKVYTQQPPEQTAIHNLEHGYVIVYYAAEGENALDAELVAALEALVNGESQVLMSPYDGLAEPLYFVAWGARQACDPPDDASADDAVDVAEGFIAEWRDGEFAPEAAAG
jgi:Protein of unknown function (DUF3105)